MPAAIVSPAGEEAQSLRKQLEGVEKDIELVSRRKLVTIVGGNTGPLNKFGPSDKVIFVEPFDLRGKDPEESVEVIETYVIESKVENDITVHKTGKRSTGKFKKRCELEPQKYRTLFGPTYKIDTSNQNGERECAEFLRILETHTDRLKTVPQPAPYHSDISNEGVLDLRNVTLNKEDVPVAILENYKPLRDLIEQKEFLLGKIREQEGEAVVPEEPKPEVKKGIFKR